MLDSLCGNLTQMVLAEVMHKVINADLMDEQYCACYVVVCICGDVGDSTIKTVPQTTYSIAWPIA